MYIKEKKILILANSNHICAHSSDGSHSSNGIVSFEKMIEIFSQSKINLSFNGSYINGTIMDRIYQIRGRNYEVPLCGSFLLAEYCKGLEEVFEIGKEIEVFYDEEDLLKKIKYYLENEDKREEIASNGYKRAISNYTLKNFELHLSNIIEKGLKNKVYRPSKIYIDDDFNKLRTFYDIQLAITFIKNKKYKFAYEVMQYIYKDGKIGYKIVFYKIYESFTYFMFNNFPSFAMKLRKKIFLNKRIKN